MKKIIIVSLIVLSLYYFDKKWFHYVSHSSKSQDSTVVKIDSALAADSCRHDSIK